MWPVNFSRLIFREFLGPIKVGAATSARNGVNLATAWHRLAKFSQASPRGKTRGGSRGNRQQDEQDEQDVQVQPWDFQDVFFLSFLLLGVRTWELENYGKVHGSFPVAWTVNCNLQLHFAQPWTIHFNFLWPFSPSFGFFLLVDLLDAFCPVMVWSLTSRNWSAARPVLLGSVRMPKGRTRNGTKSDKENFHRWFRRCFFVVDFWFLISGWKRCSMLQENDRFCRVRFLFCLGWNLLKWFIHLCVVSISALFKKTCKTKQQSGEREKLDAFQSWIIFLLKCIYPPWN